MSASLKDSPRISVNVNDVFDCMSDTSTSNSFMDVPRFARYEVRSKEEKEFGYPTDFDERFELLEQLGRGGYGTVYKARQYHTGELFAVKVLEKSRLVTSEHVERVRREVLYQSRMGPSMSVAYLFRAFEDEERVYLVMELCSGGSVCSRISSRKNGEAEVARVVREALRAVAQCHARGVMVRDVKPHNFLLLHDGDDAPVKLTDFGLAAAFTPGEAAAETLSERVGTATYMAPEVVGRLTSWPPVPKYGPKADVWSAGIMAYQLLCGRLPFRTPPHADHLTSADAIAAITLNALEFEEGGVWTRLSDDARDFVKSLLQVETADRPTAQAALHHRWLRTGQPLEGSPGGGRV